MQAVATGVVPEPHTEISKCLNCNKEFPSKLKGKKNEKKFCKEKCRVEYHVERNVKISKEEYEDFQAFIRIKR